MIKLYSINIRICRCISFLGFLLMLRFACFLIRTLRLVSYPDRGITSITGGKRLARMPFSLVSLFRRAAYEIPRTGYDIASARLTVSLTALAKSITTRGNQVGYNDGSVRMSVRILRAVSTEATELMTIERLEFFSLISHRRALSCR